MLDELKRQIALAKKSPCDKALIIPVSTGEALVKMAEAANKLQESLHRCDRDGNPQIDAGALLSLRVALTKERDASKAALSISCPECQENATSVLRCVMQEN